MAIIPELALTECNLFVECMEFVVPGPIPWIISWSLRMPYPELVSQEGIIVPVC